MVGGWPLEGSETSPPKRDHLMLRPASGTDGDIIKRLFKWSRRLFISYGPKVPKTIPAVSDVPLGMVSEQEKSDPRLE